MIDDLKNRLSSRKFALALLILLCATSIIALPAVLYIVAELKLAALMTGGEYTSLIIGVFAIYSGANVAQRKIESPITGDEDG